MRISYCGFSSIIQLNSHINFKQLTDARSSLTAPFIGNNTYFPLFEDRHVSEETRNTTTLSQHTIQDFTNDKNESPRSQYPTPTLTPNTESNKYASLLTADNTFSIDTYFHPVNNTGTTQQSSNTPNNEQHLNDLELALQNEYSTLPIADDTFSIDTSFHPVNNTGTTQQSNNTPNSEQHLNDLELALQDEVEHPPPIPTCQHCSAHSNETKLTQLIVNIDSDDTYTYSIRIIHTSSEQWLHYKNLISSNQEDPITLFKLLAEAIDEGSSSFYTPRNLKSIDYMVSQLHTSKQKILTDILSCYLGESLVNEYQRVTKTQDEYKEITQTIQSSAFSNAFDILIALKTSALLPIKVCPYCKDTKVTIPSMMKKSETFYSAIEPLQKLVKTCEEKNHTSHKLYVYFPWSKTDIIVVPKNHQITIKIASVESTSCDNLQKIYKDYYRYIAIHQIIERLQGKTGAIPEVIITSPSGLETYLRGIPKTKLAAVAHHFKIFIGIKIFDIELPKAIRQRDTPQPTYQLNLPNYHSISIQPKEQTFNLYPQLSSVKKSTCIMAALTKMHSILRLAEQQLPSASEEEEEHPLATTSQEISLISVDQPTSLTTAINLAQVTPPSIPGIPGMILKLPITMRRIIHIEASPVPLSILNPHSVSSHDLAKTYTLLYEHSRWMKNIEPPTDDMVYTLCLSGSIRLDKEKGLSVNLRNTRLSIVAINTKFIQLWNTLHQKLIHNMQENFTQEILNLFLAQEGSYLTNCTNTEIQEVINKNLHYLRHQLSLLLGTKLANLIYFHLVKDRAVSDINAPNYFHLNTIINLSKSIMDNAFTEALNPNAKIPLSSIKQGIGNSLSNGILTFILDKGRAPSLTEIEVLRTLRPTQRAKPRPSKRKINSEDIGIGPPSKIAAH